MPLPREVIAVGEGLWNVRGVFRLGPFDIGTQCSLVALQDGGHVLLDACDLSDEGWAWLERTTDGGASLRGVLHLHPFHTLHVEKMHARFPGAPLYGTRRHRAKAPALPWETASTDHPLVAERFAADLELTVPAGVALIPEDENLHFASVLAVHRRSRTLHVDDTLTAVRMPRGLRWIREDIISFHPTLGSVLEPREGAAEAFRGWARELAQRCSGVTNLCAAHIAPLLGLDDLPGRVEHALAKVEGKLAAHERQHG